MRCKLSTSHTRTIPLLLAPFDLYHQFPSTPVSLLEATFPLSPPPCLRLRKSSDRDHSLAAPGSAISKGRRRMEKALVVCGSTRPALPRTVARTEENRNCSIHPRSTASLAISPDHYTKRGLTSARAALMSASVPAPTSRHNMRPASMTSGMTLAKIRAAMKRDARGSNPVQPVKRMRMVDTITPTLPRVS